MRRTHSPINVFLACLALLATARCSAEPAQTAPTALLNNGDLVAVCGDSITEQKLYSVYIEDYLLMCQPKAALRPMQFGWSGEVTQGFTGRLDNVFRFAPNVVTTCYGMNDGGYGRWGPGVDKPYRENTEKLVDELRKRGARVVIVGSPGVVDSKFFHNPFGSVNATDYNAILAKLSAVAQDVAKEKSVPFADVHKVMADVMPRAKAKYGNDYPVAGFDGIHPQPNGHVLMAYAFLKAMNVDGNIGKITADLSANTATATDGHRVISMKGGAIDVESTRYPFCFFGEPSDPWGTAGITEFIPFNEELNRYELVVTNPGAEKLRVTWGTASREYSAEALAKGINLAADFVTNPFSESFARVEQSVRMQQDFETFLVKELLQNVPKVSDAEAAAAPVQRKALKAITDAGMNKAKYMNGLSAKAVTAVRHVIKIEAVR